MHVQEREYKNMRREGIGYLPQFDNVEECIYKLLRFYTEERGRIELKRFLEENFKQTGSRKGWSENTIRMLQNTLYNYGLIRETSDYVYIITEEGRKLLKYGNEEQLLILLHKHVKYMGELLGELEKQKLKREDLEKRAKYYYGLSFNNTDLTRRLQIFKGTGLVISNRHKEYMLTCKGEDFLEKIRGDIEQVKNKGTCSEEIHIEEKRANVEIYDIQEKMNDSTKDKEYSMCKESKEEKEVLDERQIVHNLQEKFIYYFAKHNLREKSAVFNELNFKEKKGLKKITADLIIYRPNTVVNDLKLVVEIVTEKNRNYDFLEKLFEYRTPKIGACWMVDYVTNLITIFDWKNNVYEIKNISEEFFPSDYPGMKIDFMSLKKKESIEIG